MSKFNKIINNGRIILNASTPTAMKESIPSSVNTILTPSDTNVKWRPPLQIFAGFVDVT